MAADKTILYLGPVGAPSWHFVQRFSEEHGLTCEALGDEDEIKDLLNRSFPGCVVLDGEHEVEEMIALSRMVKGDAFTGIVPLVVVVSGSEGVTAKASRFLKAGADDVLRMDMVEEERFLRLGQVLHRADRDVSVHPTTRLPGTTRIARDMQARIDAGEKFAVCYADLDHFKEFNDRYGYAYGDGVIRMLSRILRDVVRGLAPSGFVGHIGGDDFIFNLSVDHLEATCDEIIYVFDELIPYQYTEEDREAGYFLGKDRRGNIHRIPLMALSIGIVTNQFQDFEHTGQISELAAQMKGYAKSLPGSKYVVDRRHQSPTLPTASAQEEAKLAELDRKKRAQIHP